jgi:hypothetical protein
LLVKCKLIDWTSLKNLGLYIYKKSAILVYNDILRMMSQQILFGICFVLLLEEYWCASIIFIRPSKDGTYYVMALSVRPCGRPWSFQFSGIFFAIFAAIGLKLGVLLCSQELLFQFAFQCDWLIFARVIPWNLAEFHIFSVFRTFFFFWLGHNVILGEFLLAYIINLLIWFLYVQNKRPLVNKLKHYIIFSYIKLKCNF